MLKDITFRPIPDGYEFHFLLDGHNYEKVEIIRYGLNDPDADVLHDGWTILRDLMERHRDWYTEQYIEALAKKMKNVDESTLMSVFEPIVQAHPNHDNVLVPCLVRILRFEDGRVTER